MYPIGLRKRGPRGGAESGSRRPDSGCILGRIPNMITAILLASLALSPLPRGVEHVITRDGRMHIGQVTRDGDATVVETPTGKIRIPACDVLMVFETLKQAATLCSSRFDQARRIYEEARQTPERDPLRR